MFFWLSCSCQSSEEFFYESNHTDSLTFQTRNGHDTYCTFYSCYSRSQLPVDINLFLFPFALFYLKKGHILKTGLDLFYFLTKIKGRYYLSHNIHRPNRCTLLPFRYVTYSEVHHNFKHMTWNIHGYGIV